MVHGILPKYCYKNYSFTEQSRVITSNVNKDAKCINIRKKNSLCEGGNMERGEGEKEIVCADFKNIVMSWYLTIAFMELELS